MFSFLKKKISDMDIEVIEIKEMKKSGKYVTFQDDLKKICKINCKCGCDVFVVNNQLE
jgi:hypothetical protein